MPKMKTKNNCILYNENNVKIDNKKVERVQQCFCEKYIDPNDSVLELGARYGSVSCAINLILNNKKNQVSVEPDDRVWDVLTKNRDNNNCEFNIVYGLISKEKFSLNKNYDEGYFTHTVKDENSKINNYTLNEVKTKYNIKKFNVLVADCEGFLEQFFDDNPELYDELELLIYERDNDNNEGGSRRNCNYNKIEKTLINKGFKKIAFRGYGTQDLVWSKR
jgi:FkbM family methyltransferase